MAIAPINNVSFKNNSDIGFTSRKKIADNKRPSNSFSNTMVSVPLATLLALSPLNPVSAENNRNLYGNSNRTIEMTTPEMADVQQEKFGKIIQTKKIGQLTVNVRSRDGKNVSRIELQGKYDDGRPFYQGLEQYVTYNYVLCGDDGEAYQTYKMNEVRTEEYSFGRHFYRDPELCKFVKSFVKAGSDVVEPVNITRKFGYDASSSVKNVVKGNIMMNARPVSDSQCGKFLEMQSTSTSKGKYNFYLYSKDNDDETVESFAIEKVGTPGSPGFPKLKIIAIYDLVDKFGVTHNPKPLYVPSSPIILKGDGEKEFYTYYDNELHSILEQLLSQEACNKPYNHLDWSGEPKKYDMTPKGTLYDVSDKK